MDDGALLLDCAALWTSEEATALGTIKDKLPEIRAQLDGSSDSSEEEGHARRLRLLAALGPHWWMNGLATEGSQRATPHAIGVEPVSWHEAGAADHTVFDSELPRPEFEQPAAAPFLSEGTSARVVLGCCLDGGGMNAYAHSDLEGAGRLHGQALRLAIDELELLADDGDVGTRLWDVLVLKSRALDGMGRVARVSGDYVTSYQLHLLAAQAVATTAGGSGSAACQCRLRPLPNVCYANAVSNAGVAAFKAKRLERATELHRCALVRVRYTTTHACGLAWHQSSVKSCTTYSTGSSYMPACGLRVFE